jgi:hypothetical protein
MPTQEETQVREVLDRAAQDEGLQPSDAPGRPLNPAEAWRGKHGTSSLGRDWDPWTASAHLADNDVEEHAAL